MKLQNKIVLGEGVLVKETHTSRFIGIVPSLERRTLLEIPRLPKNMTRKRVRLYAELIEDEPRESRATKKFCR